MTLRENILALKQEGISNIEISRQLGCTKSTITYHLKDKYHKRTYFNDRYAKIKQQAVDYKGGKCCICDYDRCTNALDFHHVDPSIKDGDFRTMTKQSRSFETLKNELDKCILVCANCHREIHAGQILCLLEPRLGFAPSP